MASVSPVYQLVWKYSQNPRSMEQARKKGKSLAAKEVSDLRAKNMSIFFPRWPLKILF